MLNSANITPAVSILVPTYNAEPYLRQCLDSLVNQRLKDIEIICINDGSTDGSLKIIREYEAKDLRIQVIDKANSGYGSSMNIGLQAARGEYVGVVEPDDFVEPKMFAKLYKHAKKHDCDVVRCCYSRYQKGSKTYVNNYAGLPHRKLIDPKDYPRILHTDPAIWTGIYKRSWLSQEGIDFRETPGASFQDAGFYLKTFFAADRVVLLRQPFVNYRIDNPSSSVKRSDRVFVINDELADAEDFMRRDPVRTRAFAEWFHVAKYGKYRWNYERIAAEDRPDFVLRVQEEFQAARDAGELRLSLLGPKERTAVEALLSSDADAFVAARPNAFEI